MRASGMAMEKVFGVQHLDELELAPESRHAIQQVIVNPRMQISKLGVELNPEQAATKGGPAHVYWQRVWDAAKRQGLQVVSLEPTKQDITLTCFNGLLTQAVNAHAERDWPAFKRAQLLDIDRTEHSKAMRQMLAEIEKKNITWERLKEVCMGLAFHRSQKMLELAEREGVSHAIVGHMHAEDFQTLSGGRLQPAMLGSTQLLSRQYAKLIKERPAGLKKHGALIGRLEQIAERNFPSGKS